MNTEIGETDQSNILIGDAVEQLLAATHQLQFAVSSIESMNESAITLAELFVLRKLEASGEQRVGHLTNDVRLSRQRLAKLLRALEKRELVTIGSHDTDARVRLVSISQHGKTALNTAREQLHAAVDQLKVAGPKTAAILNAAKISDRLSTAAWKMRTKPDKTKVTA